MPCDALCHVTTTDMPLPCCCFPSSSIAAGRERSDMTAAAYSIASHVCCMTATYLMKRVEKPHRYFVALLLMATDSVNCLWPDSSQYTLGWCEGIAAWQGLIALPVVGIAFVDLWYCSECFYLVWDRKEEGRGLRTRAVTTLKPPSLCVTFTCSNHNILASGMYGGVWS